MHYKERENREYISLTIANEEMYRWKKGSDTLLLKVRLNDAKKVHC